LPGNSKPLTDSCKAEPLPPKAIDLSPAGQVCMTALVDAAHDYFLLG
jgi:hypothetical protein